MVYCSMESYVYKISEVNLIIFIYNSFMKNSRQSSESSVLTIEEKSSWKSL